MPSVTREYKAALAKLGQRYCHHCDEVFTPPSVHEEHERLRAETRRAAGLDPDGEGFDPHWGSSDSLEAAMSDAMETTRQALVEGDRKRGRTYASSIWDNVSACYRGALREAGTLRVVRGCIHRHRTEAAALECARGLRRRQPVAAE